MGSWDQVSKLTYLVQKYTEDDPVLLVWQIWRIKLNDKLQR